MGIGKFISSAIENYHNGNYSVALALTCSAIDATAKKSYPGTNNNERIKKFIQENMRIVSFFGLPGISTGGLRIKCDSIPEIKKDKNNLVGLEDIIYYAIRCSLIHECKPDTRIEFINKTRIGDLNDKFTLPSQIIWGLIFSVVLSETNTNERSDVALGINICGKDYELGQLWGKKESLIPELYFKKAQ
jgi:hypothetical protein